MKLSANYIAGSDDLEIRLHCSIISDDWCDGEKIVSIPYENIDDIANFLENDTDAKFVCTEAYSTDGYRDIHNVYVPRTLANMIMEKHAIYQMSK